ncbi:hypothetical protein LSAT2_015895 [Lamellibrachia satsuma]|nr:hypothetical protein LSAT2_015895 [Lamellibrachia satsuma]
MHIDIYDVRTLVDKDFDCVRLVAAAMGHNVIAVEPFDGNLRRLHKAINLGNFNERIVVVRHAVSDRRELVSLDRRNTRNQGAIRVNADTAFNQSDRVRSIFLDDLTDLALRHFPSRRAIIKVDIEGYERFAFRRCDRLLDAVYVPFIFMEWQIMGPFFKGGRESANRKLVQELIDHLLLRGYGTYCARSLARLDSIGWNRWPGEILWKHKLAKF